MSRDSQIKETQWLSQVNETHGFPGAIVAHAWFHADNAEEIIARQAAYPVLLAGDGPFYFAGEHMSYITAWQEGAVQSAHYTVSQIAERVGAKP